MAESLLALYLKLKSLHGKPSGQWKLWCKRPKTFREKQQVIIEAVLTQRANWRNVQQAVENLRKERFLSLEKLVALPVDKLAGLIIPSGFYRQKAIRLKSLAWLIMEKGGLSRIQRCCVEEIRKNLLSLSGIGPETADDILLYALEKPVFVIDEYTRRLAERLNFPVNLSYDSLQEYFEARLPEDYRIYQDFHALIVIDGKERGRRCNLKEV